MHHKDRTIIIVIFIVLIVIAIAILTILFNNNIKPVQNTNVNHLITNNPPSGAVQETSPGTNSITGSIDIPEKPNPLMTILVLTFVILIIVVAVLFFIKR